VAVNITHRTDCPLCSTAAKSAGGGYKCWNIQSNVYGALYGDWAILCHLSIAWPHQSSEGRV